MCSPPERLVLEDSFFAFVLDFIALVMLDELYACGCSPLFSGKPQSKVNCQVCIRMQSAWSALVRQHYLTCYRPRGFEGALIYKPQ